MPCSSIIKCIIVDDEPLAQDVIVQHLSSYSNIEIIDKCNNAMAAFELIHKHDINLIFLDINMPVISGLNFLKSLNNPPLVIFTTAYSEYAVEGFELDAVDYLMKPISPERFNKAIEKVNQRLFQNEEKAKAPQIENKTTRETAPAPTKKKDYIFVKSNGKLIKIKFSELIYCEGMKDYVKLHIVNDKYFVIHQTMKGLEEQLPSDQFLRIHKSYIISLPAIKSIQENLVIFSNCKAEIPFSATYKDRLMQRLT